MEILEFKYKKVDVQEIIEVVEKYTKPSGLLCNFFIFKDQLFCEIKREDLKKFVEILNKKPELSFEYLKCITAVDYIDYLEMVYLFYSFKNQWSINVKVKLDALNPQVDSIYEIYRAADWYEREMAEMFGINIIGHPNLKPLLLSGDEGFYPLRKSFEIKWEEREYLPPKKFE